MSPGDKNLHDVVQLLTVLFRMRKQHKPPLEKREQHLLMITKEHIGKVGLNEIVLTNTLQKLAQRGYLVVEMGEMWSATIF